MSSQVAQAARRVKHELRGVVVSAGLMQKTVKVRVGAQKWNKIINKVGLVQFPRSAYFMALC
jgi:small subunit ribosomal protein S17